MQSIPFTYQYTYMNTAHRHGWKRLRRHQHFSICYYFSSPHGRLPCSSAVQTIADGNVRSMHELSIRVLLSPALEKADIAYFVKSGHIGTLHFKVPVVTTFSPSFCRSSLCKFTIDVFNRLRRKKVRAV